MRRSNPRLAEILFITPHLEPTVVELKELLADVCSVHLHCSNPVKVQGDKRGWINKLRYYWLDPIVTMFRLAPSVWRYRLIITYYHRNGYWLGLLRRLFPQRARVASVWIGFAPNPPKRGFLGWLKESVTYNALVGHDLIVCNALPVIDMIKGRYPKIADKLAYARWGGGGGQALGGSPDNGYVFCGGRTNRDFDTVLEAVADLGCPTVIVTGKDARFSVNVPRNVSIYQDIPSEDFQHFVQKARIVVLALKRQDVSSGQVVLSRAMQSGKPVVVTAIAGIEDYVTDGQDAVLVAPGNAQDLKAKLGWLLDSAERRKELGLAERVTFERQFNSRVFARDLFEAVTGVCEWLRVDGKGRVKADSTRLK